MTLVRSLLNSSRLKFQFRFMGTVKLSAELDKDVFEKLESKEIPPRKHPGAEQKKCVELPDNIKTAMMKVIKDTPVKQLVKESESFSRYLHSRQPPVEINERNEKKFLFKTEVKEDLGLDFSKMTDEEVDYYRKVLRSKVDVLMKQRLYHWQNIEYVRHKCLLYLFARAAPEYAVLKNVFQEIKSRLDFQPSTLFDFGSGVGTSIWAANNTWNKSLKQIFTVDSSSDMNDLCLKILEETDRSIISKLLQRQFLPASLSGNYNIVVSSYSLLELSSMVSRLETVLNLWQKTNSILVLIEHGTMAGFKVINEARDFILGLSKEDENDSSVHVLAPCPHDLDCPRLSQDKTPCNFLAQYIPYPVKSSGTRNELYSYVVLMKGPRDADDPQWPRIVRPVLVKSRHSICRLCTGSGSLEEIIFTPSKHGKIPYRCARSSQWGDRLPVSLKYETTSTSGNDEGSSVES